MKNLSIIVLTFLLLCNLQTKDVSYADEVIGDFDVAFGQEFDQDGLILLVSEVEVGQWRMGHLPEATLFPFPSHILPNKIPMIAIRYDFVNSNAQRKIYLEEPFAFSLTDEFGNEYLMMEKPIDYHKKTQFEDQNFPSIYPGQRYGEVVFFEAPIEKSRDLYFTIFTEGAGFDRDVRVRIPVEKVKKIKPLVIQEPPQERTRRGRPKKRIGTIKIIHPPEGSRVAPGETIQIQVEVEEGTAKPNKVMIIVPTYVLEDEKLTYSYDFTVPMEQKGNFGIVVIGKWKTSEGEHIQSDSIFLTVDQTLGAKK